MNFVDIVKELVPEALSQVEVLQGRMRSNCTVHSHRRQVVT